MSKFKWIAILLIVFILLSPIAFLFLPSWNTKVQPALNLMNSLMGPGAEENIQLGSFSFVGSDSDSLLLKIDLILNNTSGGAILFPTLNLTFSYGSSHLGDGWVNPDVLIPAGSSGTVPIYAKMQKGDAFNMFLLSLIGGGLSLDISRGEAFLFLDTFGDIPAGAISIPLPSIPLPAIDMGGASFWPPTIHRVYRGNVTADMPVEVRANVTDKGGGVRSVILSWTNGTQWVNTTMQGLPLKPIFGGSATSLGSLLASAFSSYPPSCIPTTYSFGIVSGEIPAHPVSTNISYRIYIIDDFDHITLVPSTLPTYTIGTETINLTETTFSYTVASTPLANYTAVWLPSADGAAAAGGLADLLTSLADAGIDIFGAIMQGSSAFSILSGGLTLEAAQNFLYGLLLPMIEYLELKHVNPFEVLDQLLGISGGIPGLDPTYRINANQSIALDLLAEGGVSLIDLINLLDVNMSKVVESLSSSIRPPLQDGATLRESFSILLNRTFTDPVQNASFFSFLETHDLFYFNKPLLVFKYNEFTDIWVNYTAQAYSIEGDVNDTYYFGSNFNKDLLGTLLPGDNFTIIDLDFSSPGGDPALGAKYRWEYYNGSWVDLPVLVVGNITMDMTQNFTQPGRIFFAPPSNMVPVTVNNNNTNWIRLNILGTINETVPLVNSTSYSLDYVPYYFEKIATDTFGRPTQPVIPGKTDSYLHLLQNMNENNSYGMTIWGLLSARGITYSDFVEEIGGTYLTIQSPVTTTEIISATSLFLGIVVYGVLLVGVVAAVRGRKEVAGVSSIRIKKWYESMTVAPSLKMREEIGKVKTKTSEKEEY